MVYFWRFLSFSYFSIYNTSYFTVGDGQISGFSTLVKILQSDFLLGIQTFQGQLCFVFISDIKYLIVLIEVMKRLGPFNILCASDGSRIDLLFWFKIISKRPNCFHLLDDILFVLDLLFQFHDSHFIIVNFVRFEIVIKVEISLDQYASVLRLGLQTYSNHGLFFTFLLQINLLLRHFKHFLTFLIVHVF